MIPDLVLNCKNSYSCSEIKLTSLTKQPFQKNNSNGNLNYISNKLKILNRIENTINNILTFNETKSEDFMIVDKKSVSTLNPIIK
jgi:hypothetical protein